MQIEVVNNNLVKIAGEIDSSNCESLYGAFKLLVNRSQDVTVDITELSYLDSVGIGALFWLAEQFEKKRRQIKLIVLQSPVSKLLELVGLRQIRNIEIVSKK